MDALIEQFRSILGPSGILTGTDVSSRSDSWPPMGGCQARAIVRPSGTAEVSEVLRLCHAAGQTVVTHGGLTGLVGGARTGAADLVLSRFGVMFFEDPVAAFANMRRALRSGADKVSVNTAAVDRPEVLTEGAAERLPTLGTVYTWTLTFKSTRQISGSAAIVQSVSSELENNVHRRETFQLQFDGKTGPTLTTP